MIPGCFNMADEAAEIQPALRVSQLDASELDIALFDLLKSQFTSAFKYFQSNWLVNYGPEINASLRLLIWKFSIDVTESSIGQQLLDLRYHDNKHGGLWMTRRQKLLHAVFTVFGPWLSERADDAARKTQHLPHSKKFWQLMKRLQGVWKVLSLVNFLVFLTRGRYQFLLERVLGIRAVFPKPQGVRQVGFEYMDRELLWHGFAEFLFFVLPLVNFRRIKNFVSRQLVSPSGGGGAQRSAVDLTSCVVCEEWPCNPREISCKHVFCYYCVQANFSADSNYSCPGCGTGVISLENIKPVTIKIPTKIS